MKRTHNAAGRDLSYRLPMVLERTLSEKGMSVRDLAREAEINEQTLYDNLRGDTQMSLRTGLRIVETLMVSDGLAYSILKQVQKHFDKV